MLTALGSVCGFALTTLMQPTYTSAARMMVVGGADPTVPIHVRVETELALVLTPQVLARVIATERLHADREFGQSHATEWDRQIAQWGLSGWLGRAPLGADVAARFADAVRVERVGDAALFDIEVASRDPVKAARLANALVEAYLTERTELSITPEAGMDPATLARLEAAARDAEAALEAIRQPVATAEATESPHIQLAKARERLADAESRSKRLEAAVRAGANGVFDHDAEGGSLRELRRDHAEAVRRQADLLREYGPKHYRIIEVNRDIDRLRDQGLTEARRALDRVRSEVARERETIRTIERAAPTTTASVPVPQMSAEEAALARAAADARRAYETAAARARAISAGAGLMEPVMPRVLSRATVPVVTDQVNGVSLVGGGALAGLSLGLFAMLMRRPRQARPAWDLAPAVEPVAAPIGDPALQDDEENLAPVATTYQPAPISSLSNHRYTGRDVILSLGDAAPCHRAALALARPASAHGRVVLVEVDGPVDAEPMARLGLGDVLEGAARFTEALHADPDSSLHRMPPGRRVATRFQRFPLVLDALSATYDRVIIALGELPEAAELIATLDQADRLIVATDAAPVVGAEAEAIAALEAVVGLTGASLHVLAAPPAPVAEARPAPKATGWRNVG